MRTATFDPKAMTEVYLSAIGPARKAQEQGFRSVERLARFQYAVAGDCLESGLAQMSAAIIARTPADLLATQSVLSQKFGEKLRVRAQEFAGLAAEVQGVIKQAAAVLVGTAMPLKKAS